MRQAARCDREAARRDRLRPASDGRDRLPALRGRGHATALPLARSAPRGEVVCAGAVVVRGDGREVRAAHRRGKRGAGIHRERRRRRLRATSRPTPSASFPTTRARSNAREGAAGMDLFIADAWRLGRGLGSRVLRRFVDEIVFGANGAARMRRGTRPRATTASIRAFEKAGFARWKVIRMEGAEPECVMRRLRGTHMSATRKASGRNARPTPLSIHAIYAPIVRDTFISFEIDPPSMDEIARRIASTLGTHPWLVFERRRATSRATRTRSEHRERPAYQWSVDVSCYVHERARRRGIASRLYPALFRILERQGFTNAFAGIALPNEASVRNARRPWASSRSGPTRTWATSAAPGTTWCGCSARSPRIAPQPSAPLAAPLARRERDRGSARGALGLRRPRVLHDLARLALEGVALARAGFSWRREMSGKWRSSTSRSCVFQQDFVGRHPLGGIDAAHVERRRVAAQRLVAALVRVLVEIGERQLAQRAVDGIAVAQRRAVGLGDRAPGAVAAEERRSRADSRSSRSRGASASGGSPFAQSAAAATIAPSMQCARRWRSTSRTDSTVSPPISWLIGIAFRNAWIFAGVDRRFRVRELARREAQVFRAARCRRARAGALARRATRFAFFALRFLAPSCALLAARNRLVHRRQLARHARAAPHPVGRDYLGHVDGPAV